MILVGLLAAALALSLVALLLGQTLGRRTGWVIAAGLALLGIVLAGIAWSTPGLRADVPWLPSLGVALRLRLDGLAVVFALVVLGIGALVMAYAVSYLPDGRHGSFYGLLTFFAAAMLGLVLSDDLVLTWVMWEFTTLTSFLLITQSGPKGKAPAIRTLLITGAGGLCLLGGVALTVTATGTTQLGEALASDVWRRDPGTAAAVAVLVALAAFTKSAQFPFHAWLPDAMVASTPVSAYLHAAAMVKAGIYLLLRFSTALHAVPAWNVLLVSVGMVTALMGAIFALQRFDLKELLAYSTVSQLGFLVATIGLGTTYALLGAVAHVIGHALFKSALFMGVGLLDHETGTRDLRKLSGLRHVMPGTAAVMVLAAASMAGLPPLLGFVSKEALFKAMTEAPFGPAAVVVLCIAAVLAATTTFAYSARLLLPFVGPRLAEPPHEAPVAMVAPPAVGAAAGVVLGLVGPVAQPLVDAAVTAITGKPAASDLSLWHGLTPALAMSATVLGLGAVLVAARTPLDRALHRELSPVRAVAVVEGARDGAIALGARVGWLTRSDGPFRHLGLPLASLVVLVFALAGSVTVPDAAGASPWDWLWVALVAVGVALTLIARSRVALVTTVGVVGFTTSLLFFTLGATDVALTQLLVEILTVVVMVLLLSRLPATFHHTRAPRTAVAAVMALLVGATGFVLALAVLREDGLGVAGRYYLEHAKALTAGENVVNTILVDFRAFDTFGETVVLGVAAIAVVVALEARGLLPRTPSPITVASDNPVRDARGNTIVLRAAALIVGPLLVLLSFWFFLRGHYHPGGGFIAALIAGAGLCLVYLAAPNDRIPALKSRTTGLVGAGVLVAAGIGLLGLSAGSVFTPLAVKVAGLTLSTGLLFDVGVYATVIGLLATALARLGVEGGEPPPVRRPEAITTRGKAD